MYMVHTYTHGHTYMYIHVHVCMQIERQTDGYINK